MFNLINRGDVVTMECVEKLIKKDMMHPLISQKLKEKDIISLERVSNEYIFQYKKKKQ